VEVGCSMLIQYVGCSWLGGVTTLRGDDAQLPQPPAAMQQQPAWCRQHIRQSMSWHSPPAHPSPWRAAACSSRRCSAGSASARPVRSTAVARLKALARMPAAAQAPTAAAASAAPEPGASSRARRVQRASNRAAPCARGRVSALRPPRSCLLQPLERPTGDALCAGVSARGQSRTAPASYGEACSHGVHPPREPLQRAGGWIYQPLRNINPLDIGHGVVRMFKG